MSGPVTLARRKQGRGPRAVFLHPVGLSGRFWDDVVARLVNTMQCIAVDLRGHGESPWDGQSFSLDDLASDVAAMLDDEGGQPALVIGCSMGGMVAQGVALVAPHLVSGLLIANSGASLPPPAKEGLKQRARMANDEPEAHAEDCLGRWFSRRFAAEQPERVKVIRNELLSTAPRVIANSWLAIADLDYASRLSAIGCRAHIVSGELDTSSPPAAVAGHASLFARGSHQVVAAVGHLTPYEAPELFAEIVLGLAAELK